MINNVKYRKYLILRDIRTKMMSISFMQLVKKNIRFLESIGKCYSKMRKLLCLSHEKQSSSEILFLLNEAS